MRWRVLLAFVLVMAACGGAEPVADTNCPSPDAPTDRVRFASIVIVGAVTEWDGTSAKVEIQEIWRGPDLPAVLTITPEAGRAYTAGVRYLLFPTTPAISVFVDTPCSASVRWTDDLAPLRPEGARTPGQPPVEDPDLPWEWILAAAAAALILAAGRRLLERRRHPAAEWDPDFSFDKSRSG